jgi:hypothetical protein
MCFSVCVDVCVDVCVNYAVYITNQMTSDPGATMSFVADPKKVVSSFLLLRSHTYSQLEDTFWRTQAQHAFLFAKVKESFESAR